jgi:mRNA interferase RelE/StbE
MYSIDFSDKALKQLKPMDKEIQKRINNSLSRLRVRPEKHVKRLVDSRYFRFRVGEYRLVLGINISTFTITVVIIGHRKNIYKEL